MVYFRQLLRMVTNILSLLQAITFVMGTYTCYMRNLNHWTCIYKAKVENQLNRKIKPVRSDHNGKYYDRYDISVRCPRPFTNF